MKKIIFILVVVFTTIFTSYAQLNVVSSGSVNKNSYLAKDMYSNITNNEKGYYLNIKDCQCNQYITILLGGNKSEYIASLEYLLSWIKTSPKKSYIDIQTDEGIVTFYKYTQTQLAVSYGGVEYMKKKITNLILGGIAGTSQGNKYNDALMGYVRVSLIEKAMYN